MSTKLEYVLKPISELTANPRNARTHSRDQIKKISASIKEFGFIAPAIIDKDGVLIAGHGRMEAAKKLKMTEIPCVIADHLTPAQLRAYMLADNRIQLDGGWDEDILKIELSELAALDFDLSFTGFDVSEVSSYVRRAEVDEIEDDVPEAPEVPKTVLGDIWLLGNHRLMCGDSTDAGSVALLMGGEKADMVFTDPPYGINEKGDRSNRGGIGKGGLAKAKKYDDFIDDSVQYAVDAYNIAEQVLKIDRQVWWGANYYCHSLPQSNNWFVWDKRVEEKQSDTQSDCELAWVKSKWSSVRIFRHLWKGMMKASENGKSRVHPTQKPIALAEWVFDYFGDVETVLDFFGGSGSTLIACEKTNRHCRMMELDPKYCDVIIKRWQDYTGQDAVHAETGKTYNAL